VRLTGSQLGDASLLTTQRKTSTGVVDARPPYRWVILTLAWLLYFAFGLINSALSILITPVMEELNLTYAQMGVILGSWQLVYIFFAQPAGIIIDALGSYKSLFLGVAVISLSAALRWFAVTFESLLISVALFGIGGPMISIGLPKLVAFWFLGRERSVATGVYTTGNTIGSIVALSTTTNVFMPLLGDWRRVFVLYSGIALSTALLWLAAGWRLQAADPAQSPATSRGGERAFDAMARLWKKRNIWLIVIMGVTSFLVSHGLANWLPKMLELKGMTVSEAGFATSSLHLFAIFGSILIPRLPYTVGSKKRAIALTLFVLGVATLVLSVANGPLLWIGLAVVGVTMRGLTPLLMVTLMDLPEVDSQQMGAVGGLYFAIGEIGGFSGPFILGLLKDVTGSFTSGMIFLVAVAELSIVFTLLLHEDAADQQTQET
jgi:CP family cyanate transporter-like MFS transporter